MRTAAKMPILRSTNSDANLMLVPGRDSKFDQRDEILPDGEFRSWCDFLNSLNNTSEVTTL